MEILLLKTVQIAMGTLLTVLGDKADHELKQSKTQSACVRAEDQQ